MNILKHKKQGANPRTNIVKWGGCEDLTTGQIVDNLRLYESIKFTSQINLCKCDFKPLTHGEVVFCRHCGAVKPNGSI